MSRAVDRRIEHQVWPNLEEQELLKRQRADMDDQIKMEPRSKGLITCWRIMRMFKPSLFFIAPLAALLWMMATGAGGCASTSAHGPVHPSRVSETDARALGPPSQDEVVFQPALLASYFKMPEAAEAVTALRENRLHDAYRSFDELAATFSDAALTSRARFMTAYLAQLVGYSERALQELPGLAEELPLLADTAFERAACAAKDLGRHEMAYELAAKVSDKSAYKGDMRLLEADSLRALGRCAEAVPIYEEIAATIPESRRTEAMLRFVQCQAALFVQGDIGVEVAQEAARTAELIVAQAPSSVFADAATEARAVLLKALGQREPSEPQERKAALLAYERAKILFDDMRNAEAEKALSRVVRLSRGEGSSLYCKASQDLAIVVRRQRDHGRAAALFESVAEECDDAELRVRALYSGAKAYQSAGRPRDAIRLFRAIEQDYPEHSYADDARLGAARCHLALGERTDFSDLLSTLPDLYPTGDMRAEALWTLAYDNLSRGDLLAARRALSEYHGLFPRETGWYSAGRASYWLARVEELLGSCEAAMELYEKCLAAAPLSYYALLAHSRLTTADPSRAAAWLEQLAPVEAHLELTIDQTLLDAFPRLATAVELLRLGLLTRMRRELDGLLSIADLPPRVPLAAALLALQAGSYRDVKRFAASSTRYRLHYPAGQAADAWRLAYPMAFEDEVDQSAVDHGVERALVWAVMREESSFDPGVESWANAIGLMQLLLPTAKSVAQRLGLKVNRRNLRKPEINISLGAAYLSALSKKFRHPALAIAGYNAGEGAVGRWLAQWSSGQDLDLFIESIPYDQTRGYTKRVLSSYATYSFLYSGAPRQIPRISLILP